MIEIIDLKDSNIIGCIIDGKINTEDIKRISDIVEDKLKKHYKLRVYVEVINLGGISLHALMNDFKLGIKHYNKFEKKAVVTDKGWMKSLTPIVDKLFTNIEVKSFSFEDKKEALDWVRN